MLYALPELTILRMWDVSLVITHTSLVRAICQHGAQ